MNKKILLVELMQEDVRIPVHAQYDDAGKPMSYVSELTGVRIFRSVNQDHEEVSMYNGQTNKCYDDVNIFQPYVGGRVVAVSSPVNEADTHHWMITTLNGLDEGTQRLMFSGFKRANELEALYLNKVFPEFLEKTAELSARNITI